MTRTVMLLDVDGVLNASKACGWGTAPRTATVHAYGMGFPFYWAPELVDRIVALHDAGHVEIRWCATWLDIGTDGVERALRLPAFPPAFTHSSSTFRSEKVEAALAVVAAGDRLIWADDEAIPVHGEARDLLDAADALLIAPDDRYGLRPKDMDAIDEFLRAAACQDCGGLLPGGCSCPVDEAAEQEAIDEDAAEAVHRRDVDHLWRTR